MTRPTTTKTMQTFGYPDTLVAEYEWWSVLLRPKQPTLGALVLAARCDVDAFSALPAPAFAELSVVTAAIEKALRSFCDYAKINYLMLMMVDREPHFHVLPRYDGVREFQGQSFEDAGWPKQPRLDAVIDLTPALRAAMIDALTRLWPREGLRP